MMACPSAQKCSRRAAGGAVREGCDSCTRAWFEGPYRGRVRTRSLQLAHDDRRPDPRMGAFVRRGPPCLMSKENPCRVGGPIGRGEPSRDRPSERSQRGWLPAAGVPTPTPCRFQRDWGWADRSPPADTPAASRDLAVEVQRDRTAVGLTKSVRFVKNFAFRLNVLGWISGNPSAGCFTRRAQREGRRKAVGAGARRSRLHSSCEKRREGVVAETDLFASFRAVSKRWEATSPQRRSFISRTIFASSCETPSSAAIADCCALSSSA